MRPSQNRLSPRGVPGIPYILTDVNPEDHVPKFINWCPEPRLEVPVLIENAVVREIVLAVYIHELFIMEDRSRVVDVLSAVGKTQNDGDTVGCLSHLVERFEGVVDKPGLQKKGLGRVARNRELREAQNIHSLCPRVLNVSENLAKIPFHISYADVYLSET